jgi:PAS domain S-box-containing protein
MEAKIKRKVSIKKKIAVFILLSFFIVGVLGLSLIYWNEHKLLFKTISRDNLLLVKALADAMNRILTREIRSTQTFMTSSERVLKVKEYNLKYAGMSDEAKDAYFKQMDRRWEKVPDNDAVIAEYTKSAVGKRLKEIVENDPSIAEIFITDKYGGLVAASDRTSDFYQADEEWWQKSFDNGKGSVFVDRVGFDDSSQSLSIAIVSPIRDESNAVVGVCKNVLEINRLFEPLRNFHFGISGHVALVDKQGEFIFHPGIKPMAAKLQHGVIEKFISQESGALVVEYDDLHHKSTCYSFVKIKHPALYSSGIEWWLCIVQDKDEMFAPLRRLGINFILAIFIALAALMATGFFFANLLVEPIIKLRDTMVKVAGGDLDSRVEIRTNDEIEELSDAFNSMLDKLKSSFINVNVLNQEIALRKRTEELMHASEERYRKLFTESKDAILIFSPEEGFLSGNPAAIKLFACKDEKELGMMKLSDLSPERQPDGSISADLSKQMVILAEKNGSFKFYWVYRRLNGEDFPAEVLFSRFETGGKVLLQATVREVAQ